MDPNGEDAALAHTASVFPVTRIYTTSDGTSKFEDISIPLNNVNWLGALSASQPVDKVFFRETSGAYDLDWHPAPQRQYIVITEGTVEITTGDNVTRRFGVGEPVTVLLVEDTSGQGHKSRAVDGGKRRSIFITLA